MQCRLALNARCPCTGDLCDAWQTSFTPKVPYKIPVRAQAHCSVYDYEKHRSVQNHPTVNADVPLGSSVLTDVGPIFFFFFSFFSYDYYLLVAADMNPRYA